MCRLNVDVGVENNGHIAFVRGLDSISRSVLSDKYFHSTRHGCGLMNICYSSGNVGNICCHF